MSQEDYEQTCMFLKNTGQLETSSYPGEYDELSELEKKTLHYWIEHAIQPAKQVSRHNSYDLKHYFERQTEIYTTNGQFKGAMLVAGYLPENIKELNWHYRIKPTYDKRRFPRRALSGITQLPTYRTRPLGEIEPELQALIQKVHNSYRTQKATT